jgi:hypothetical protein
MRSRHTIKQGIQPTPSNHDASINGNTGVKRWACLSAVVTVYVTCCLVSGPGPQLTNERWNTAYAPLVQWLTGQIPPLAISMTRVLEHPAPGQGKLCVGVSVYHREEPYIHGLLHTLSKDSIGHATNIMRQSAKKPSLPVSLTIYWLPANTEETSPGMQTMRQLSTLGYNVVRSDLLIRQTRLSALNSSDCNMWGCSGSAADFVISFPINPPHFYGSMLSDIVQRQPECAAVLILEDDTIAALGRRSEVTSIVENIKHLDANRA